MKPILLIIVFLQSLLVASSAYALELMMVEQPGCHYCKKWNAEIAPIYPKTELGKAAPLIRQDLRSDFPEGLELDGKVLFTPTFILIDNNVEIDRIEGYPGEDFFWGLLEQIFEDAEIARESYSVVQ